MFLKNPSKVEFEISGENVQLNQCIRKVQQVRIIPEWDIRHWNF